MCVTCFAACHPGCLGYCNGPDSIHCERCREGYEQNEQEGCLGKFLSCVNLDSAVFMYYKDLYSAIFLFSYICRHLRIWYNLLMHRNRLVCSDKLISVFLFNFVILCHSCKHQHQLLILSTLCLLLYLNCYYFFAFCY